LGSRPTFNSVVVVAATTAAATTIREGKRVGEACVQPCVRSHDQRGCRCRRAAAAAAAVIAVVVVPNTTKMPPMR
jgi:hypothetical protein